MAGPRQLVAPPTFDARQYGLLSVVQPRDPQGAPDAPSWRNGVTWQDICGMAGTTWSAFCLTPTSVPASGAVADKAANTNRATFGATPFTVFAELDCDEVGYSPDELRAASSDALTRVEAFQVERAFWTGAAGGQAAKVFPHLAADTVITDPGSTILSITLQCAVATVSGSIPLDIVEGLQRLIFQAEQLYGGQLTIHVPANLGETLFQWGLVEVNNQQIRTKSGHLVALGAGYTGSGPSGAIPSNAAWIYATGPVFMYRSGIETFRLDQMLDKATNTLKMIAERTYVLGYSCCTLAGVPISLGGDITGTPLSAT